MPSSPLPPDPIVPKGSASAAADHAPVDTSKILNYNPAMRYQD